MSKRPNNMTKRNLLHRGLSALLAVVMTVCLLPAVTPTAQAHWADPYAQKLVDWGVMRGSQGNLALNRSITRAEFVAMMNRAYGYTRTAGHPFRDVRQRDWYNDDIDIAYNMGYFKGTSATTASPRATLSREQAAVLLARNMMLQPNSGEGLQFSDSRSLSSWSRGLVAAAADNGIITGRSDGSFRPKTAITRGEVAAMLARAIGTPIQDKGEHVLGGVYGNVTINTAGVKLKDTTITGNLYLTGGIDLGDVVLENVDVMGEIIVSGAGESHSAKSSVTLRNVTASAMTVDSIIDQFVTIRAEGNTDIDKTTVRTNAYVNDSALPGFGLHLIEQDGGKLLQLAGNTKEVINKTPDSDLQVVAGTADKVTVDEKATGSKVLVDGDAVVDELDLDVATTVTGDGDIKNLNVAAAGSTVEQLPDNIDIRPGITADVNGSEMDSAQAAEMSADPRLLAGYPRAKNVAPNSATLVFSGNKPGTIYWAVSAEADGSIGEDDLIEPPTYGGRILKSGSINATAAKTEYTADLSGLTQDGSYYISAILVDARGNRSPVKVAAFATPDGTVPAFVRPDGSDPTFTENPYASREEVLVAQVTGVPNKSCMLYYALLPSAAAAPTPAEFKANAVRGNLGYGSVSVTKNVSVTVDVNRGPLKEKTKYAAYLWLTDYDGAKSSQVYKVDIDIPDSTPPVLTYVSSVPQTNAVDVNFKVNEGATVYWVIMPEGRKNEADFEELLDESECMPDSVPSDPEKKTILQFKIEGGQGKITKNGSQRVADADAMKQMTFTPSGLDPKISAYTIYMVAKDAAGNYSNIEKRQVKTKDSTKPTFISQTFSQYSGNDNTKDPLVNSDIVLTFSESVKGGSGRGAEFQNLYNKVKEAKTDAEKAAAREALAKALFAYVKLCRGETKLDDRNPAPYITEISNAPADKAASPSWVIDYRYAEVDVEEGSMTITFPTRQNADGTIAGDSALNLESGATYHFVLKDIKDLEGNDMDEDQQPVPFTVSFAKVLIQEGSLRTISVPKADGSGDEEVRVDYHFKVLPQDVERVDASLYWELMLGFNEAVEITLYSRDIDADGNPIPADALWTREGPMAIAGGSAKGRTAWLPSQTTMPKYGKVREMKTTVQKEFVVHVDRLAGYADPFDANKEDVTLRVSVAAGTETRLQENVRNLPISDYDALINNPGSGIRCMETETYTRPKDFMDQTLPTVSDGTSIQNIRDTGAKITLYLEGNKPGYVHYLAIPVPPENIYWKKDATSSETSLAGEELVESLISGVTKYTPTLDQLEAKDPANNYGDDHPDLTKVPLMLNDPDWKTTDTASKGLILVEPDYTSFTGSMDFSQYSVVKGVSDTAYVGGAPLTIDLADKLQANTMYILCLLPSGLTTKPDAENSKDKIVCYRFTTNMPERPKLALSADAERKVTYMAKEANGDVAYMDYFLVRDDETNIKSLQKFKGTFTPDPGKTTAYTAKYPAGMSVLGAMATYVDNDPTRGTVFDEYASTSDKLEFARLIHSGSEGNGTDWQGVVANRRDVRLDATLNFATQLANDDRSYILVAMARRSTSSRDQNYAFNALFPVQNKDDQPPMVKRVLFDVEPTAKNGGIKTGGTMTIQFDEPLYVLESNNNPVKIDNCAFTPHQDVNSPEKNGDFYSLYSVVGSCSRNISPSGVNSHSSSRGPIDEIKFTLGAMNVGQSGYVTIGNSHTISDKAGNAGSAQNRDAALTIQFIIENAGTADAPNIRARVTSVSRGWLAPGATLN